MKSSQLHTLIANIFLCASYLVEDKIKSVVLIVMFLMHVGFAIHSLVKGE